MSLGWRDGKWEDTVLEVLGISDYRGMSIGLGGEAMRLSRGDIHLSPPSKATSNTSHSPKRWLLSHMVTK